MDSNAKAINRNTRGFAALPPERRSEISRKGGVIAHKKGAAHEWDAGTTKEAGRKGGLASSARRTLTSPQRATPTKPAPAVTPQTLPAAGLASPKPAND